MMHIQGIGLQYGDMGWNGFVARCLPHGGTTVETSASPDLKAMLPGVNLRRVSGIGRLALSAACQALINGGATLPLTEETSCDTGLFIGTGLGPAGSSFAFMDSILDDGPHLASPTHFSHSVQNAFCAFVGMALNIQGPAATICQFGLSFAGAVQAAADALCAGKIKYALAGAVEESSEKMRLVRAQAESLSGASGNNQLPAPAPERDCAVFFLLSMDAENSIAALRGPKWLTSKSVCHGCPDAFPIQRPYARHTASQALDLALCPSLLRESENGRLICRYAEPVFDMMAEIAVERIE